LKSFGEWKFTYSALLINGDMHRPIITLTTDFGLKDPYVAEMKGMILTICPDAVVVDISHQVEKFDVRMGAYVLASAAPYFPKGTIHVAVVDPGVGTMRRGIIVHTKDAYFVGPDNGMLSLAVRKESVPVRIYRINRKRVTLSKVSNTFHGRDVFAPVAAWLAVGKLPSDFGRSIKKMAASGFAEVAKNKDMIVGEVIHLDDFGNIVTNLSRECLQLVRIGQVINMRLRDRRLRLKFCRTYAEVERHKPSALIGSHGFLEISVNQGNATHMFQAKKADKITLSLTKS
jgi:S-adenosylmethionine hydrolase